MSVLPTDGLYNYSHPHLTQIDLGSSNYTYDASGDDPLIDADSNLTDAFDSRARRGLPIGEAVVSAVFLFIFIIITIIGNILVILSVFTYRPLKNVQNFFIVSLACADLAVAILVMPFNIINFILEYWIFGNVFCNVWLTCDVLCCTASILNLCAIATDRYWAIHDPINYANKRTLKRVLIMIALVWGVSAVISIPPLVGWNNWDKNTGDKMTCALTDEKGYVIYSASGSFFIPLLIMSFVYLKIFLATRRRLRERAKRSAAVNVMVRHIDTNYTNNACTKQTAIEPVDASSSDTPDDVVLAVDESNNILQKSNNDSTHNHNNKSQHHSANRGPHHHHTPNKATNDARAPLTKQNNSSRNKGNNVTQFYEEKQRISLSKERRAARTLGIIMGVFCLCWLPFFLMYVILPFCSSCQRMDVRAENFIVWLGYVNSGLNPVIYTVFNIDFRRAFKRLLTGKAIRR
ncbi:putative G-protein coupled receptor No18 [Tubulanus polymorphus]|uniref:putative G-protein coupled receptor No18 n=1 Tax=Tubulanus polymorphus TaxID=672921 RepID=UPI003DA23BD1